MRGLRISDLPGDPIQALIRSMDVALSGGEAFLIEQPPNVFGAGSLIHPKLRAAMTKLMRRQLPHFRLTAESM